VSIKNGQTNSLLINEEFKDNGVKYVLSKFEYDLYHEEDDIQLPVIRVKHFKLPNKGERWKIFSDAKIVFVIEGAKLGKKEREFLRNINGINFLIKEYKAGIKSLNSLKKNIKQCLDAK
jgi:hypothetical protein